MSDFIHFCYEKFKHLWFVAIAALLICAVMNILKTMGAISVEARTISSIFMLSNMFLWTLISISGLLYFFENKTEDDEEKDD